MEMNVRAHRCARYESSRVSMAGASSGERALEKGRTRPGLTVEPGGGCWPESVHDAMHGAEEPQWGLIGPLGST